VHADHVHVQQLLLNLAMNGMDAIQISRDLRRKLTVETTKLSDVEVQVSVFDTGDGIPEDKLDEVFKTFYSTKPEGSGLGLSIARTIVEACDGKIWAENSPSGGSIFRFTLPLAKEAS